MINDRTIYLDHAAATPVRKEVLDKMLPVLCNFEGTTGGSHAIARRTRLIIEEAERTVLSCLDTDTGCIRFAESGNQASHLAILGLAHNFKCGHVITTEDESEGVLAACNVLESQGFEVTYLPTNAQGCVVLDEIENCIRKNTVLISVSIVNQYTGCRQPIEEIAAICEYHNILLHTEASHGCLLELDVHSLNVHSLSLSSHLIQGPQGIGALWTRQGVDFNYPYLGCENLAGIVGFTQALCFITDERSDSIAYFRGLQSEFRNLLNQSLWGIQVQGNNDGHPGIITINVSGADHRDLVYQLDRWGVCVAETKYGIRVSLGRTNTKIELEAAVESLSACLRHLQVSCLNAA